MATQKEIWEVWQGDTLICSAGMGLTEPQARNKVENEQRNGIKMEARKALNKPEPQIWCQCGHISGHHGIQPPFICATGGKDGCEYGCTGFKKAADPRTCDDCGNPRCSMVASGYSQPYPDVAPTYSEWDELWLCRECRDNRKLTHKIHFGVNPLTDW